MELLTIQLLGGFRLHHNNREIKALQAERLTLLLAYLSTNLETSFTRKQISFVFWPDSTEEQARTNLRNLLHLLRRAFPEIDLFLEVDSQLIRWRNNATIQVDANQFKDALAQAKTAKDENERVRQFRAAINFYNGEFLPGFFENWILLQREELQQSYLTALTQLAKHLEDVRNYEEAIEVTSRLLRHDPLNEAAHQRAIQLHALNNDRAGALQAYHNCATILKQELNVEPSKEIKTIYEQLIHANENLSGEIKTEQAAQGRRLIGRKQEWNQLREFWKSASKGKSQAVFLLGEAGIGKTRLANELLQWAQRQGIYTAFAQCYPLEGNLPFAPVVTWLRAAGIREELENLSPLWKKELARLLPELEKTESASGQKWQRQRLFEAVARGLLGSGAPKLLVLDDAQWSDQDTLEFLHYLLRYDPSAKLLVVVTVRLEEMDEHHPLNNLRAGLQTRNQITELELGPLTEDEVGLLASDVLGRELSVETEARIFHETEGNPFFTVEVLRSGDYESGGSLPSGLRSTLTRRLGQLSTEARDLVGLAAAIGREFDFHLLATASQADENSLVRALDELWSRRIIQTQQGDTYSFTHGKLQDAAYETLSAIRRPILHRRIGESLLARNSESALIADHFERAGQYPLAMEQYLKAAEEARRVFANQNAIAHLEQALKLMTEKVGIKDEAQKQLARSTNEMLGDIYDLSTNVQKSSEAYEAALKFIEPSEHFVHARVLGKLSKVVSYEIDYERGTKLFEQAVSALGERNADNEIEWWDNWLKMHFDRAWIEYDRNYVDRLEPILEAIRPVAEQSGDADKLGQYYFLAPLVYFRRYGYQMTDEVMRYFKLAMETSRKGTDLEVRTRGIFGYAFGQYMTNQCEEAVQYFTEALNLAEQIGYVEQQIYNLTYLAGAHRRAGNLDQCGVIAKRGLALSEREGYKSFAATARANLGWIAWKQNDIRKAKELSQQAVKEWGPYYPFCWFGLWTLIDLSLLALQTDDAVDYARKLKAPGQQVFAKEADDLLAGAIAAAEKGETTRAAALLAKAVDWAKINHYL